MENLPRLMGNGWLWGSYGGMGVWAWRGGVQDWRVLWRLSLRVTLPTSVIFHPPPYSPAHSAYTQRFILSSTPFFFLHLLHSTPLLSSSCHSVFHYRGVSVSSLHCYFTSKPPPPPHFFRLLSSDRHSPEPHPGKRCVSSPHSSSL